MLFVPDLNGIGTTAICFMKTLAYRHLLGDTPDKADAQTLIRYAWSLPIASAMIGMTSLSDIEQNAAWASTFQPMPPNEMHELSNRLSLANKVALDHYFANHEDICKAAILQKSIRKQ